MLEGLLTWTQRIATALETNALDFLTCTVTELSDLPLVPPLGLSMANAFTQRKVYVSVMR